MSLPPNGEAVAVAWAKTVPGINAATVATSLPEPNDDFAEHGFVTATTFGGAPNPHTGLQHTRVQYDAWAYQPNSKRKPWGKAATLLAQLKDDCEGNSTGARVVELPGDLDDARVRSVVVSVDPMRIPDEDYARYRMDVTITWSRKR